MTTSWLFEQWLPLVSDAKDTWDQVQIVGGIATSLLVTGAIGAATIVYNIKQNKAANAQKTQDIQLARNRAVAELIPFLGSDDPRHVEAALIVTAEIADDAMAGRFALLYGAEGGFAALHRLRQSPTADVATRAEEAFATLVQELAKSVVRVHSEGSSYRSATETLGIVVGAPDLVIVPYYMIRRDNLPSHIRVADGDYIADVERYGESDEDPVTVLQAEVRLKPIPLAADDSANAGQEAFILSQQRDGRWLTHSATVQGNRSRQELTLSK